MSEGSEPRAGQDILVVDADARIRRGLERLLTEAGLTVTAVGDEERARDQLTNKFFAVALIDLDTPTTDAGLELVRFARAHAPLTGTIVMAARKTFETAAAALRVGALDVVPKTQDVVTYLRDRVQALASNIRATVDRDKLLAEVAEVHELFLREMLEMQKRVTDLEDRILNHDGSSSPSINALGKLNVLLVDDEASLQAGLDKSLVADKGWALRTVQTGGEALDAAHQVRFQIAVVKETLPDLPSSMVVKTIRSANPDVVVLVFSPPGDSAVGEVKMVEQSRLITLVPSFTDPQQLVTSLEEIRQALKQKAKERRYMKEFRKDHMEFLQQYNRVRERVTKK